jgi:putative transposase
MELPTWSLTIIATLDGFRDMNVKYGITHKDDINPERELLKDKVSDAFEDSNYSVGARIITAIISNDGTELSRYRADKLMKELGLFSCQPSKPAYKKAEKPHTQIPNTLNREFSPERPNQVWCGDVTYIWTGNRWAYLAVVMDLFGRKPVGWAVSRSPDSELTAKALRMAFELRGRPQGVMFHSDQDCQLY